MVKTGPAFPRTRREEEHAPHWAVQVAIGALLAGLLLAACYL
ncbi:MAG: hypothetical protein WC997_16640 [Porticoccaceae bacterium]